MNFLDKICDHFLYFDNNNIYGRGTIDDKGPAIAALYAMKAVADNYKLDKRVRNKDKCSKHMARRNCKKISQIKAQV